MMGIGLGLRWIGVEPWLYRVAPAGARGRLVGFHETLIALAAFVAPVLSSCVGLRSTAIFWLGIATTLSSLVPLTLARGHPEKAIYTSPKTAHAPSRSTLRELVFRQGIVIALFGGLIDSAVPGLFSLFAHRHGLSVSQIAQLLAMFGLGSLLMQFGVGWIADHRGLKVAAIACATGTALAAAVLTLPVHYIAVAVAMLLLGGFVTSFLTLAIIAGTKTVSGNMGRNVSMLSMIFTTSAVAGPLLAGAAMKTVSTDALMWFASAAAAAMAVALQMTRPLRV
jgi:predicted MFS family arabinose efflux permease